MNTVPPVSATTGAKVMIIDDDLMVVKIVERVLARLRVQAITAQQSTGILQLIAQHRPSLVLLDVNMPGLDGPALVKLIRADAEIRETKILLFSGLEPKVLEEKAKSCGADGYVPKSVGGLGRFIESWLKDSGSQESVA